jgi:hypothetical protein
MRLAIMEQSDPTRRCRQHRTRAVEVGRRRNVRELALLLGLNASAIAEGLVDLAERDPAVKRLVAIRHAA